MMLRPIFVTHHPKVNGLLHRLKHVLFIFAARRNYMQTHFRSLLLNNAGVRVLGKHLYLVECKLKFSMSEKGASKNHPQKISSLAINENS
jgi:hypothetical protein